MTVPPTATYRVQIQPGFGFDEVAALSDYLDALGVSHVYLSPVLQPAPGSRHGYDVVDHTRLNVEAGGQEAFERMAASLSGRGISAIADVVPNHMSMPIPLRLNAALWSVFRDGPRSPYADWFDVDWTVPDRAVLMPVLADRIGKVLAAGDISMDTAGPEAVLRYHEHEFPVRPGTEHLPLEELVERQWYRLAWWRVADEELNYRRFFDVGSLAAVRTELPEVFRATHALLLRLVAEGRLSGLRIDHPDGLADPREYLRRLTAATGGGAWVVVEKILEAEEELPADWPCAGTTGYDALQRICGLFVDPAGAAPLSELLAEFTGEPADLASVISQAKREVVEQGLYAEVHRLVDLLTEITHGDIALRDHTRRSLHDAAIELLVAFDRYRAYVVPGEPASTESVAVVEEATERARPFVPEEFGEALELVRDLVLGRPVGTPAAEPGRAARRAELVVRFQQTCGPVMAKGVEDTAFYRWHRLVSLNEVGGDPGHFGVAPEEFHAFAARQHRAWPTTMTALSTHDTKRSEDVRARLAALAEFTEEWSEAVRGWREAAGRYRSAEGWPDPAVEYLLWQTLVGLRGFPPDSRPPEAARLTRYLVKAAREAKQLTSWTNPDAGYEAALVAFAEAVLADDGVDAAIAEFCDLIDGPARVAVLGQKVVQLTMPGVPDVYQGTELVNLRMVDPDNRRPVDYTQPRGRLARLDAGEPPRDLDDEKLLVVARVLRLRRQHPECFVGADSTYAPLATSSGNALAFARGPGGADPTVVALVTRLPVALQRHGGWDAHTVVLPTGDWTDVLTGRTTPGGAQRIADLLASLPVALLHRAG